MPHENCEYKSILDSFNTQLYQPSLQYCVERNLNSIKNSAEHSLDISVVAAEVWSNDIMQQLIDFHLIIRLLPNTAAVRAVLQ